MRIEVELVDGSGVQSTQWRYVLGLKSEGKGQQRVLISEERVEKDGQILLSRPDAGDQSDPEIWTQTHLEQIGSNLSLPAVGRVLCSLHLFFCILSPSC